MWGDKNNSSLMDQLQVLQNKAAKTILATPYLTSSTEALNKLHWKSLTHRRKLHRILTTYKFKNNLIEFNLELPKINHLYNTREEIPYSSVSRRQKNGESKNCFTRLVKSTTIWTIILDPLNS
jgi:hypothetical protein